jgi:YbbR domain-containing protein
MLKWLLPNLRTFALALSLAMMVWVSAVTASDPDEVRDYPRAIALEIVGQDPRLVITGETPSQIRLSLRAPASTWEEMAANEGSVRAILDLSGLGAGQHQAPVQVQISKHPVRIISVSPTQVALTLENLATKTVPVQLSLRGEPAVGYQAGTPRLTPAEITLSGAQSLVDQVQAIRADLNIAGVRQDVQSSVPLRMVNADGQTVAGLALSPDSAQVNISVVQRGGYRDIAVKLNARGQVAGGYRITNISVFPPVLTVYSSNPSLVNELPGYVETAPLNLNGLMEELDTRVELALPTGITVVGEQTVRVQVGIEAIEGSLSLNDIPIEVVGLPPEFSATISPEKVDVILSGPLPALEKLTANDIRIFIDLSGLSLGTHQVSPQSTILAEGVEVQSLNPATIEVTLVPAASPTP